MAEREPAGRWRILTVLAVAELLGMAVWFAGNVVAPELKIRWALSAGEIGWLTSSVQLGFVVGTLAAAILNLADLVPSRWYFATAAVLAAGANGLLLVAPGYRGALATRFLTGLCLAGVYPPAMKMASTWFTKSRGLAIGAIVGALTIGKATPYLVEASDDASIALVIATTSIGALVAAFLVAVTYRDGPYAFPKRPFSWSLVGVVVRHRELRLVTAGYLGHMWELYCFWTWVAAFLTASLTASLGPSATALARGRVGIAAFAAIAIGAIGCVWGGRAADRYGRERVVAWALAVSGGCAVLVGLGFGRSWWVLMPIVLVWGVAVIADSAQFSALVTEVAPPHAVGTALTLQTSVGFLLTMVTIQLMPRVAALISWRWAFSVLAVGPVFGIAAIRRLAAVRQGGQVVPKTI